MVARVLCGTAELLPTALLNPEQTGNALVLRLTGSPWGIGIAQQFGQFVFGIAVTETLITHTQIAAFGSIKAFD